MIHEILEQDAVFDGKPYFPPGGMLIELLNFYACGGTKQAVKELRESGEAPDATRYKVRLIIEIEQYED